VAILQGLAERFQRVDRELGQLVEERAALIRCKGSRGSISKSRKSKADVLVLQVAGTLATRSPAHAKDEKAIFEAFLAAHPAFAVEVREFRQPDATFPDIVAVLKNGAEVDFELGEWLDRAQMAAAKRYDALAEAILDAIGPQQSNSSRHFRAVMLCPREDAGAFDAADKTGFRAALTTLIQETDRQWPSERFWHSPQGRICRELVAYPPLGKYLRSVNVDPLVVCGRERPWPTGQPWVFVKARVGSYSPDTAVRAMTGILAQKIKHYPSFNWPTRLIIYYGKAVAYNMPYLGIQTREFADVAALAAEAVRGQRTFEKIYLLQALEPGLEAYEIYPACVRCA
jgi:hypothetical protein